MLMNAITAAMLNAGPPPDPPRKWTTANKILAATAAAGLVGDWLTTVDIARHRPYRYEQNPILGRQPSVGNVNTYFALTALGGAALANKLPSKWRNVFLGGLTALEGAMIGRNRSIGLNFNFKI